VGQLEEHQHVIALVLLEEHGSCHRVKIVPLTLTRLLLVMVIALSVPPAKQQLVPANSWQLIVSVLQGMGLLITNAQSVPRVTTSHQLATPFALLALPDPPPPMMAILMLLIIPLMTVSAMLESIQTATLVLPVPLEPTRPMLVMQHATLAASTPPTQLVQPRVCVLQASTVMVHDVYPAWSTPTRHHQVTLHVLPVVTVSKPEPVQLLALQVPQNQRPITPL
jgi:hypothetical protein